jgi:hypothetical protein
MPRPNEISLGDLLRAFGELSPDDEDRFAIAKLLKLTPFVSLEELKQGGGVPLKPARTVTTEGGGAVAGGDAADDARSLASRIAARRETIKLARAAAAQQVVVTLMSEEASPLSDDMPTLPSELVKVTDAAAPVSPWGENVPVLPTANEQSASEPLGFEPLLVPTWTRALLSAAVARRVNDGPIDVKRVVELVARGEVTVNLPRYPRPTLARGVQVLVDRSETMLPFLEDQTWLEEQVQKVVGPGCLTTLYFEGCPTRRAGPGGKSGWKKYPTARQPKSGTVLLLLTDLGIGRPLWPGASAGEGEWLEFAAAIRKRACPVVALVPYGPARWPASLQKFMTIIQWDRPTSASFVHARVGKGHNA